MLFCSALLLCCLSFLVGYSSAVLTTNATYTPASSGPYVTVTGYALTAGSASVYKTEQGTSGCNCRNKCFVDDHCKGVSYNTTFFCSFTNVTITAATVAFHVDNSSVLMFWGSKVPQATFSTAADGLVYAYMKTQLTWEGANATCAMMPGFRLAVFSDASQLLVADSLRSSHGDVLVGLRKVNDAAVFTNGVHFTASGVSSYILAGSLTDTSKLCYEMHGQKMENQDCNNHQKEYLCQSVF